MIVGVLIGAIIILIGLSLFLQATYGITIEFWPFIFIIFGLLIVLGALFGRRRRSGYSPSPP